MGVIELIALGTQAFIAILLVIIGFMAKNWIVQMQNRIKDVENNNQEIVTNYKDRFEKVNLSISDLKESLLREFGYLKDYLNENYERRK